MFLKQKIANVVRGLKQKWSTVETKSYLWDREYAGGRWDHCEHTPDAFIYGYIYKYGMNGSVLDLGCGSGNTANELDTGKYHDYTGIDISDVALKKAACRSVGIGREKKNSYIQGDIIGYVPAQKHDVILFRESIYYVPRIKIKPMLERYSEYLTKRGVFVVHISVNGTKKKKIEKILSIIESNFTVLEMDSPGIAGDFVVVFRQNR